jgi:hypothetical protein
MTDSEKIKQLAEIIFIDNERLDVLGLQISELIQIRIADGGDVAGLENRLTHHAEQLSALFRDAATWRAEMRKVFGLG